MSSALQAAKGPAGVGAPCQAGSTNTEKDQEMNETKGITMEMALARSEARARTNSSRLRDIQDMLATVSHLNEALHMAAGSLLNINADWCNALQSVSNEMDNKLQVVIDQMEEIRKELK